jgi:integrase
MLVLGYEKKKIKKEAKISEATYWRAKAEFDRLSDAKKERIKELVTKEDKAKARFMEYPFVYRWVQLMKSEKIKSWRKRYNACRRIWEILQKKNPENWTVDDIKIGVIPELRKRCKCIFHYLIAIRSFRPDMKEKLSTKREKPKPNFEWKRIFERMIENNGEKLNEFLEVGDFRAQLVKRLHITLGCREGTKGNTGIMGLEWNKVNWSKKTIDIFEGKTGGGFYWIDCPLDLFGEKTFEMLKEFWVKKGKPKEGKIFEDMEYHSYPHLQNMASLRGIYEASAKKIGEEFGSRHITPHFARKLHASLLNNKGIPLELVAGDKPFGVMGVGWEDLTTLKKYYLAFTKSKVKENREKARHIIEEEVIM